MIKILDENRKRWEAQEIAEQAEETHTELSEAEVEISDEEEPTKRSVDTPSIHDFIPHPQTRYLTSVFFASSRFSYCLSFRQIFY